jgi:hypothetical protein
MKYPDLDIYRFRIRLKLNGDLVTPRYKGSLLRGIFAWSFRNTVCVTKQPVCEGCMLKRECSYFKIFETELPVSHIIILTGNQKSTSSVCAKSSGGRQTQNSKRGDPRN